jgi:anti-anti-sigma factor
MQLFITSIQGGKTSAMKVSMTRREGALIVRIAGDFAGPPVDDLQKSLESELDSGCSLIVDLSSSSTLRPDAAGLLVGLTHERMDNGAQVWLAGVQPGVRKVLQTTFPAGHDFRIAATVQDALRAILTGGGDYSHRRKPAYSTTSEEWSSLSLIAPYEAKGRGIGPRGARALQEQVANRTKQREAAAVE